MAGYCDFSKSNNAVSAEENGRFPFSEAARRLRVKPAAIKALMTPSEWHHTSGWYNQTDYYDCALLIAIADDRPADELARFHDQEEIDEARELLAKLRDWKPAKKSAKTWTGCKVAWLEWGGTRKHPTATERTAEGCTVEHTGGAFVAVALPDGSTMKKKIGSRGFRVSRDGRTVISENGAIFDGR